MWPRKMAVADKLKEHGWYLSEEGINILGVNGSVGDIKACIRAALDVDLREISSGSFPEDVGKGKLECLPGKIVVQIQKIRNISAPKSNEESQAAPRMLKLSLSDGQTCCQAIEMEHISSISLNTPPGTKLFLKTDLPMAHGILLLRPASIEVLGGKVPHLVEKWELNRSLAKHTRGRVGEEGGPPPWIPFGEKILRINSQDRNFKSLDNTKDKENRENTEFEAQRKDAIAEAARGGAKKVFGGGNKPLLDHNVQQIVDHGFSVEQAEYALRLFRNSVDRALKSLQKKEDGQRRDDRDRDRERERERRGGEVRVKEERPERRKRGVREEEAGAPPKPSGKVTLFDFFEDKLPVQNDKEPDIRNIVSNGGTLGGVDRRLMNLDQQVRGSSAGKGNRSERMLSHPQPQQRRGGSRGGGNSGGSSTRGGRGNQISTSSNTWGGAGESRGGSSGPMGYSHREERTERGRHSSGQGGSLGNQSQTLPPQKPPRFQNQQRLQQQQQQQQHQQQHQQQQQQHHQQQHQQHQQQHQQHQQHQQQQQQHHHQQQQQEQPQHQQQHHPQQHQQHPHQPHQQQQHPHQQHPQHQQHQHQQHLQQQHQPQHQPPTHHQQQQQPQHQLNQDSGYGQQSWLSAYNDSYSNDNWPIGNPANNGKIRDDYVNHGDSYLSSYDGGRNIAPRPGFTSGYDMSLEGQVNRGLGMKMDRLGGGRQFSSQQDALTQKLSALQVQGGLGRDGFGYSNRPQGPSAQQNQLYNMNYSYKDPSPTPAQPLGSPPGLSSPPGYGGGSGGGGGVYNTQSNHFLPEQKPWQWHEGDKCMAKYWEDNMYYNAEVTGVSERTCVVRFVEYGNFEEVLQDHCIPFTQDELGQTIQSSSAFSSSSDTLSAQNNNQNHFSGVLEFRRGGTRPYVKGAGGAGPGGAGAAERKPPRAQQQMYVPPAQRK